MNFHRWMYRDGRPNRLAKFLNWAWAWLHAAGIAPNYLVTLEVVGRLSGKPIRFPLILTVVHGERYLVSMLGENTNWVQNVRAAHGKARLLHGTAEDVLLEEVEVSRRAPILKAFAQHAPGARPHLAVDQHALVAEFATIAAQYPVFRLRIQEG
jgi:hypothetical protein